MNLISSLEFPSHSLFEVRVIAGALHCSWANVILGQVIMHRANVILGQVINLHKLVVHHFWHHCCHFVLVVFTLT